MHTWVLRVQRFAEISMLAIFLLGVGSWSYAVGPAFTTAGTVVRGIVSLPLAVADNVEGFIHPAAPTPPGAIRTLPGPTGSVIEPETTAPPVPARPSGIEPVNPWGEAAGLALIVAILAGGGVACALATMLLLAWARRRAGNGTVSLHFGPAPTGAHLSASLATVAVVVTTVLATAVAEHAHWIIALGVAIGGATVLRPILDDPSVLAIIDPLAPVRR